VQIRESDLPGVLVVAPELVEDDRGAFARTFSREDFEERGLDPNISQCSVSFNRIAGTLRGMHFQVGEAAEAKLVRCTAGRMFDVAVDVRLDSPNYLRWVGIELSASNRLALAIPRGFAHGFLTLEDATEVLYQISAPYQPLAARGFKWDDPAIGITWPAEPVVISERDRSYAQLEQS
jgi:dTDP-4-dehydrorhamnose 3,5-epimerase